MPPRSARSSKAKRAKRSGATGARSSPASWPRSICRPIVRGRTFRQLLARVRARVVSTIRHQEYPFSLLVERLNLPRDLSRPPLFQTTFVLQRFHRFPQLSRVMLPDEKEAAIPFADLLLEP